ncbi:MAG: hypothetical protein K6E36_06390 [Oscillospiraceae bacterium]|nr:hypothetical protein [Oscillospiraceae bacterium]
MKPKGTLFLRRNFLLTEGLYAAAACCFADSLLHAAILSYILAFLMLFSVPLTALLPLRVPFPVRILVYSVTAGLVYVPAVMSARIMFDPSEVGKAGVFLPLLILCTALSESCTELLVPKKLTSFLLSLFCCMAGVCTAFLILGTLRELLGSGTLLGRTVFPSAPVPLFAAPCGGIILTVMLSAAVCAPFRTEKEAA